MMVKSSYWWLNPHGKSTIFFYGDKSAVSSGFRWRDIVGEAVQSHLKVKIIGQ
jgi:hypothetical protein